MLGSAGLVTAAFLLRAEETAAAFATWAASLFVLLRQVPARR
jgi:hypothetical protein